MLRHLITISILSISMLLSIDFYLQAQNPIPVPTKKRETSQDKNKGKGKSASANSNSANKRAPGNKGNTFTVNGVKFEMVPVEGGKIQMGSIDSEAFDKEKPVHGEYVSNFMIGKTEVTQDLWQAVMGSNPSKFKGKDRPVECVSWDDCQKFISKLNKITGKNFRLPSEAEWEYAAKGGNKSRGYKYSGSNEIGEVAWYELNSTQETHPVAKKLPNELGLYDMSGNVYEWTADKISDNYKSARRVADKYRNIRGGCWYNPSRFCRVSSRGDAEEFRGGDENGFRLAL